MISDDACARRSSGSILWTFNAIARAAASPLPSAHREPAEVDELLA